MASHSRLYQSTSTMECEINELSYHVDASHKQACTDLEKASQFITDALQNEFQRNLAVRMIIHRLEDRAAENGRRLSEQVESNRQLKLQVDELQKQLQNKDKSLAQAKQSITMLKNELRDLRQQLHSQENSQRTIQEVTEWLQDGERQPNVVEEEGSVLQNPFVGIKEEVADGGYPCSQSVGDTDASTEHTNSSSADIKAELVKEEGEMLDMAPIDSPETSHSPDLVRPLRSSAQLVDCRETRLQQAATSDNYEEGEQPDTGRGSLPPLSAIPKFPAIPEIKVENGRPSECSSLGKDISSMSAMEKDHQDVKIEDQPNLEQEQDQHTSTGQAQQHCCKHCGKRFSQANGLRKHKCVHSGERPYECGHCGKRFSHPQNLSNHRRIHTGVKPYHCECGKSFTHSGSLKEHQHTHTGEKPYQCTECSRRFSLASSLRAHRRIHTGDKPYHCGQCGKSFTQAGNLMTHRLVHTGEKPHQCMECGRRFTQLGHLRRHQRIHTGDKPA
ncbi:zinc finger and SCAN domain-containing protein 2-like isoform X1 [Engraulis encrasicolus]|uniref:zinc finger and SCAN domain-containing protein 2-like isoform X1 n=1 Tax=Engraulis encrasicolus TaxID=184585 RepID=UPI002FD5E5E6